jgi:hypothetical protein
MIREDQVLVVNVMVIDSTSEIMFLNVIIQPASVLVKLSVTVKIHKYKGLHDGHHFFFNGHEGAQHIQA